MKTIRVLVLEDDLETIERLVGCLKTLEGEKKGRDIAVTVLAEYTQVEEYLNKVKTNSFDIILLDRDCKAGGSYHTLNFNIYPVEKVIGISSTPPYNEELKAKGVKRLVHKDYQDLDTFIKKVKGHIGEMLSDVG